MKYAVKQRSDFRYFKDVDEVIFPCEKGSEDIVTFIPTVITKEEQKAIIDLSYLNASLTIEDVIPYILQLKEIHYNILIQISYPFKDAEVALMKENNIPFMASLRGGGCHDFETLYAQKEAGVSEVYIVEGLGFRLNEIHKIIKNTEIKVRVIPNITQCALGSRNYIPTEHKFWIRPEDTPFYEPYVDTFELYNRDDRLSIIYEVYKQKLWSGYLSDIILDAEDIKIANTAIPPYFGNQRLDCKQRCLYEGCAVCEANLEFAKKFEQTEEEIYYPKTRIDIIKKEQKNEIGDN